MSSDNNTVIKIVRLSTGEELLAKVKEGSSSDYVHLSDVTILIPTESNSLGLAPFMAYSDTKDGFELSKNFIMFAVDPVDGLKNQYEKMFSKIITLTPPKVVV